MYFLIKMVDDFNCTSYYFIALICVLRESENLLASFVLKYFFKDVCNN